jgi:hypothetical protein
MSHSMAATLELFDHLRAQILRSSVDCCSVPLGSGDYMGCHSLTLDDRFAIKFPRQDSSNLAWVINRWHRTPQLSTALLPGDVVE